MNILTPFRSGGAVISRVIALMVAAFLVAGCQSTMLTADGLQANGFRPIVRPLDATAFANIERRGQSAFVIDLDTGQTLYEDEPDALRYPASLTKLMTLYLLFEAVETGRLTLDTPLPVSARAESREPSKLWVKAGETLQVRWAAQALAVRSANDVATVIAESLAGSEEAFAIQMTQKARALGMNHTRFTNASGLPNPGQISSARDMAILARAVRVRFPQYTGLFSVKSFEYNGRTFHATNKLLGKVAGLDGMKTGYINDSGSHLVATVSRGGRRLIVVVLGGQSARARDAQVTELIERYAGPAS